MLLSPEKIPSDPYPFGTHPKISQLILFSYDPGIFQATASAQRFRVSEFVQNPFKKSHDFLQPSSFPGHKPCWFSKPDIVEVCLPSAGLLG